MRKALDIILQTLTVMFVLCAIVSVGGADFDTTSLITICSRSVIFSALAYACAVIHINIF